jgi:hypothetical protein
MKEKLNAYMEEEYQSTIKLLEDNPFWIQNATKKKRIIWDSANRCLGAVMFAQELGLPYEDTQAYDDYLEKFKKLVLDI